MTKFSPDIHDVVAADAGEAAATMRAPTSAAVVTVFFAVVPSGMGFPLVNVGACLVRSPWWESCNQNPDLRSIIFPTMGMTDLAGLRVAAHFKARRGVAVEIL